MLWRPIQIMQLYKKLQAFRGYSCGTTPLLTMCGNHPDSDSPPPINTNKLKSLLLFTLLWPRINLQPFYTFFRKLAMPDCIFLHVKFRQINFHGSFSLCLFLWN